MDRADYDDEHTSELKRSREEAESAVQKLKKHGWAIYPERIPLQGQWGFYCVSTYQDGKGACHKRAHSVRWNLYDNELRPVTVECRDDLDLLSFIWQHATHDGFGYFEYGDGDVGFVCYCRGRRGQSLVLRVSSDIDHILSGDAFELLYRYENED
jgi:hypothetical protein